MKKTCSGGKTLSERFWETKSFSQMSDREWESLCDGCGKCCLHKLEDIDTNEVYYTAVSCKNLDLSSCRCVDYEQRHKRVANCIVLDREKINEYHWLPSTCAYRLLSEGRPLEFWHPLISGDSSSVYQAGICVSDVAISEENVDLNDLEDHIIHWVI